MNSHSQMQFVNMTFSESKGAMTEVDSNPRLYHHDNAPLSTYLLAQ